MLPSPYARVSLALTLLLQEQSLFLWCVPFLPEPSLSLVLGIPDFHESRPFCHTCPFSPLVKTKMFELEVAFEHLIREDGLLGTLWVVLSPECHFCLKRENGCQWSYWVTGEALVRLGGLPSSSQFC